MEWKSEESYQRSWEGEGDAQWVRLLMVVVVRSTVGGVGLGGIVYFKWLDPPGSAWTGITANVLKVAA